MFEILLPGMQGRPSPHNNFLSHPLVVAGLVVVAIFLTVSSVRIVLRARAILAEQKALEASRLELEQRKRDLEAGLKNSNSPEVVERIAKEKLNLKNPGEEVVVVKTEAQSASSSERRSFINRIVPDWLSNFFEFLAR